MFIKPRLYLFFNITTFVKMKKIFSAVRDLNFDAK